MRHERFQHQIFLPPHFREGESNNRLAGLLAFRLRRITVAGQLSIVQISESRDSHFHGACCATPIYSLQRTKFLGFKITQRSTDVKMFFQTSFLTAASLR